MRARIRIGLLAAGLGVTALLAGCPGLPGAGGGAGGNAAQTPPGVLPPPGLKSGGVRTIIGTTVTPPDNGTLLVSYTVGAGWDANAKPQLTEQWTPVRRITVTESTVLLEGLNFDGRLAKLPKDQNRLLALDKVSSLDWRYEEAPAPASGKAPAGGASKPPAKAGGAKQPAGASTTPPASRSGR